MMIERFFLRHPRSIGESYGEHFLVALSFAVSMLIGGLALVVHAVVPGLFVRNGSQTISNLHDRMVQNRRNSVPNICEE